MQPQSFGYGPHVVEKYLARQFLLFLEFRVTNEERVSMITYFCSVKTNLTGFHLGFHYFVCSIEKLIAVSKWKFLSDGWTRSFLDFISRYVELWIKKELGQFCIVNSYLNLFVLPWQACIQMVIHKHIFSKKCIHF